MGYSINQLSKQYLFVPLLRECQMEEPTALLEAEIFLQMI